jgi:hypothetical protein
MGWAVLLAIFHSVKVKTYGRNNNNWRYLQNRSIILSNSMLKWPHLQYMYTPIENKEAIFEDRKQILLLRGPRMVC